MAGASTPPRATRRGSLTYPFGGARFSGYIFGFAVFLKPFASWQLFHIPPSALTNVHCDGADVLGRETRSLWAQLTESPTFSDRVRVIDKYLLPLAVNARSPTSIMRSAQHMSNRRGAVRLNTLASQTPWASDSMSADSQRRWDFLLNSSPELLAFRWH